MVFSARDGAATPFRPDGIGDLQLGGLDPAAARELLDQRLGDTAPEVTHRLIAESGGNPLALLELPESSRRSWIAADGWLRQFSQCCCSRPPTTPAS